MEKVVPGLWQSMNNKGEHGARSQSHIKPGIYFQESSEPEHELLVLPFSQYYPVVPEEQSGSQKIHYVCLIRFSFFLFLVSMSK